MKSFVYGVDQPPQKRGDFIDTHETSDSSPVAISGRVSTTYVAGQMTDNTWLPATHKKGWVKQATAETHRRNEREWAREVIKSRRADAPLPKEPPRTIGGFMAV
jgi:hypothetical protein